MDRGKILWEEYLENWQGDWGRYLDVDGDGIPYRTVLGNRHPKSPYLGRGTGHDEYAVYSEDPQVWVRVNQRLKRKMETARGLLPKPVTVTRPDASLGIIAFGSTLPAILEARDLLMEEGLPTDFLRVRAIPFAPEVRDFIQSHERTYVVEMNRDGQMHQLLTMEVPDLATLLISVAYSDGLPLTARWVKEAILAKEQ
jgi:2-oxoglutarate ferredoxin oxidoreductase subunit alpha